jgi:hypothetical protein
MSEWMCDTKSSLQFFFSCLGRVVRVRVWLVRTHAEGVARKSTLVCVLCVCGACSEYVGLLERARLWGWPEEWWLEEYTHTCICNEQCSGVEVYRAKRAQLYEHLRVRVCVCVCGGVG